MEPMEYILAANGLLAALRIILPEIDKRVKSGEIDASHQLAQLAAIDELRNPASAAYTGPEMQPSGVPPSPVT